MIGRTRLELAGADPLDRKWQIYQKLMAAQAPFEGFTYCIDHGEQVVWVTISGEPRYAENGEFLGYRGTATGEIRTFLDVQNRHLDLNSRVMST